MKGLPLSSPFNFILVSTLFVVVFGLAGQSTFSRKTNPVPIQIFTWTCLSDGRCARNLVNKTKDILSDIDEPTFSFVAGCKSVCGHYGGLWPKPTGETDLGKVLLPFNFEDLSLKIENKDFQDQTESDLLEDWMTQAFAVFSTNVRKLLPSGEAIRSRQSLPRSIEKRSLVIVSSSVHSTNLELSIRAKEGYSLSIQHVASHEVRNQVIVKIIAASYYGYRHALETLSQLITYDPHEQCLRIPEKAKVEDSPIFPYRGMLIDTGRNFYSMDSLRRMVDAMSYNKMNILHWHMNEQQSFPFVSQRVPELMSHGAYSENEVYYMDEVSSLAMYAKQRGVLLLPEFDAPGHAAYGWQNWPESKGMGNLTTCMSNVWKNDAKTFAAEPPAGQLNPLNDNLYEVLEDLYKDLIEAFSTPVSSKDSSILPMFHMGGDEVNFLCWATEKFIRDWMIRNGYEVDPTVTPEGYLNLWGKFQEKALKKLVSANQGKLFKDGVILWTSDLTRPDRVTRFLNKEIYVIHAWTTGFDTALSEWLRMKYRIILSNYDAWYFDCGYGSWLYSGVGENNNWCSPYKDWRVMYENSPRKMVENFGMEWSTYREQILGGEGAMWSEQVDEFAAEGKIWPRACAVAERLWSDPVMPVMPLNLNISTPEAAYKANWWSEPERRLLEQRHRMAVIRGIRADALQPEFCRQNDGYCYNMPKVNSAPSLPSFHNGERMQIDESERINQMVRIVYNHTKTKLQPLWTVLKIGIVFLVLAIVVLRRRFFLAALANVGNVFGRLVARKNI